MFASLNPFQAQFFQYSVAGFLPQRRWTRQAPAKRQDVNWHGEEVEASSKRRYGLSFPILYSP